MRINLRNRISRDEFDYQVLKSSLGSYASPRDRITLLLRSGEIIRIRKGLYIFGEAYRRHPVCLELLANLIYGPSVISLDYALGYYGLIPERVNTITSVTTGRARGFDTPVGRFTYRPTPSLSMGADRIEAGDASFLIATPERALADKIRDSRGVSVNTQKEMKTYLFDDLRLASDAGQRLNPETMAELATLLDSRKVFLCAAVLENERRKK